MTVASHGENHQMEVHAQVAVKNMKPVCNPAPKDFMGSSQLLQHGEGLAPPSNCMT